MPIDSSALTSPEVTTPPLVRRLDDWHDFAGVVSAGPVSSPSFIWRGQQDAQWYLQSSFDRWLQSVNAKADPEVLAVRHLQRFKLATRGRRGANPLHFKDDNEWWALAQHNAMKTPLLDWTESPYIALFFAFEKASAGGLDRAVWGYFLPTIRGRELKPVIGRRLSDETTQGAADEPLVIPIRPTQDDNQRLLCQAGLFTRAPLGTRFEKWVAQYARVDRASGSLVKLVIPDIDREGCLRSLNRMNINHMSLFPDIYGAGMYCNHALSISDYALDI